MTGSFLSLVAFRLPALLRKSEGDLDRLSHLVIGLAWPRSHCQSCQATVRLRDLIPIISYVSLHGRCRDCGIAFGARELLMEVCGAAAGLASVVIFGATFKAVLCFLLLSLLLGVSAVLQNGEGWNLNARRAGTVPAGRDQAHDVS